MTTTTRVKPQFGRQANTIPVDRLRQQQGAGRKGGRSLEATPNIGLNLKGATSPIDLILDNSGPLIAGQSEWATAKHGKRGERGWRKLHIGVNGAGEFVARVRTDENVDGTETGLGLIDQVEGDIACVTGDAAYDTAAIYAASGTRGAEVVVPPVKGTVVSRSKLPLSARDTTVLKVNAMGQRK